MPKRLGRSGPALLVLAAVIALWLATGVSVGVVVVFLAYHLLFVIVPGWLVYRLLRPGDTMALRQLVFGWALGYVLEVLCFAATAALHHRSALVAYPPAVIVIAAILWRRRVRAATRGAPPEIALPRAWPWVVAIVCLAALALLGIEYFGADPLPGHVARVSYGIDTVWYLSLAGEALHHWPVSDPTVAGQPLFYHLFSTFDPAAISQVTGVDLPTVFFRLYMVPMAVLTVLGLVLAGVTFGGVWVGPIAAILGLLVGELNLDPHVGYKFANELSDDVLAISPSFLFGAAFFAPLLALLGELRTRSIQSRSGLAGTLAVFALLSIGAIGAKAPTAVVLVGGLSAFLVWYAGSRRALHRPLAAALAVVGLASLAFWALSYSGAGSDQLALDPPGVVRQMGVISYVLGQLGVHGSGTVLIWIVMSVVGVVGAYGAQLAGVLGAPEGNGAPAGPEAREGAMLLLALFVFGQLPYLLYTHPGLSQVFFSEYGVFAACVLSAEGLRQLWLGSDRRRVLAIFTIAVALLALLVALTLPSLLGLHGSERSNVYFDADFVLAAALALAYLVSLTRRRVASRLWPFVAGAALALGVTGRIVTVAGPTADRLAADRPLYSQTGPGMTQDLYRALSWINVHTSSNAVIAVNNFRDWSLYWSGGWAEPDDFYYSAFAQRPVFLEGWMYTDAAAAAGNPVYYGKRLLFTGRIALNNEIFQWAHAGALRQAAQWYGVTYLLVDRVHNHANPRLGTIARLVYWNHDAAVYRVPRVDLLGPPSTLRVSRPAPRAGRRRL